MHFTKMHGIGNDYVYVNGFQETVEDPATVARAVADRHLGIGGDGLILIQPPTAPENDCRMEMYNADGSRAQMCGNGIRCVGKYAYDHAIARRETLRVETDDGVKTLRLILAANGTAAAVEVDMGPPRLARAQVPFVDGAAPSEPAIDVPLNVREHTFRTTAVSMGNPHSVVRLDRPGEPAIQGFSTVDAIQLEDWGPEFENHPFFPERTNTEFITLQSRTEMQFRVWERGSGETLACGTGACAAVVASCLNGWSEREVLVHLRGGDLRIRWLPDEDGKPGHVLMTGAAAEVFQGEWPG